MYTLNFINFMASLISLKRVNSFHSYNTPVILIQNIMQCTTLASSDFNKIFFKSFWKDTTRKKNAIRHHKRAEITVLTFYIPEVVEEYARVTICAGSMGNLKKRQ
jgi:hypothetical protein